MQAFNLFKTIICRSNQTQTLQHQQKEFFFSFFGGGWGGWFRGKGSEKIIDFNYYMVDKEVGDRKGGSLYCPHDKLANFMEC